MNLPPNTLALLSIGILFWLTPGCNSKTSAPEGVTSLEPVVVLAVASTTQGSKEKIASPTKVPATTLRANGPNILVIYTDDQSCQTLSCYDDAPDWVSTPNIDRLASEGVRFMQCYGAPSCAVSRLMFLTGLLPHAIQGVEALDDSTNYDPQRCRFFPALLKQTGYSTALIGKWHLGKDFGQGRDWDHSVVWEQPPGLGGCKNAYHDPSLSVDGGPAEIAQGYSTDLYTDAAVRYIRRKHDKPWFLWVCYNAPHGPIQPHPRHQDRYRDQKSQTPLLATPAIHGMRLNPAVHDETSRNYHRTMCAVDEGVAAIRKSLEDSGELDNTLIIFTSDNGYAWGENGVMGKLAPYEAHMRVPLIVRYPKAAPRIAVCRQSVSITDLTPTILAAAEVASPWAMHGHDLRPILDEPTAPWNHPAVLENFYLHFGSDTDGGRTTGATLGIPWWISLADRRYHYIRVLVDDVVEEFYDRREDPRQLRNLALDPKQAALLADYRSRLVAELKRTDAKLVDRMPIPRTVDDATELGQKTPADSELRR